MKFKEFIGERLVITELARKINYSPGHLYHILKGRSKVGKKLAKLLEEASGGKLKAEELINEYKEKNKIDSSC